MTFIVPILIVLVAVLFLAVPTQGHDAVTPGVLPPIGGNDR